MNKINASEFCKLLSPHTRGQVNAKQWKDLLKILQMEIGKQLNQNDCEIHLPFGTFSKIENKQQFIKKSINGVENVPIKNKYQARCSCNQLKELVNDGEN